MTATQPLDFEGSVVFPSQQLTSYRYRLSCADDQLSIWLEDRKSKMQWESGKLSMKDFVPADGVIPQASIIDYALCFRDCMSDVRMDDKSGESPGPLCDLQPLRRDKWSLEFVLKLKVFKSVWTPKYRIGLNPVPLEQVDILASKVRDLEEQIEATRFPQRVYFDVTAKGNPGPNRNIVWNGTNNDSFKFEDSGEIEFLVSGLYLVHAIIHCTNSNNSVAFSLMKGSQSVKACIDSGGLNSYNGNSTFNASPLTHTIMMTKSDKLRVLYGGNGTVHSGYLMAFLLCEAESG